MWDNHAARKIRKTFKTEAAAKAWRDDTGSGIRRGAVTSNRAPFLRDALDDLEAGMITGAVQTRSGTPYKHSVAADYRRAAGRLRTRWGAARLGDIHRRDVQRLVGELQAQGASPSTIRNALMPLRVVYRLAVEDGVVATSPLAGLRLPAVRGTRDKVVTPAMAHMLIDALEPDDRAVWALGFYAGLRRGEILGLRWADVDMTGRVIHVEQAWCSHTRAMTTPKSRSGVRTVPMAGELRRLLLEAQLAAGRAGGLVSNPGKDRPMQAATFAAHARKAWKAADLEGLTLHNARHVYASLLIAAGVNVKAISEYMGRAWITITLDQYGHLLPGARAESAAMLDALLTGGSTGGQALESV